jgi:hypothetical protein
MRRLIAFAGLSVTASLFAHATPAAACDPQQPPWCQNACTIVPPAYYRVWYDTGGPNSPLPPFWEITDRCSN